MKNMKLGEEGQTRQKSRSFVPLALILVALAAVGTLVLRRPAESERLTFASEKKGSNANQPKDASRPRQMEKRKPRDANEKPLQPPDHNHPAFSERVRERERMVTYDIKNRGVSDPNVLRAMRTVPRHAFVQRWDLERAYADHPLPIGLNQTISQPYIVAYMTEYLELDANSKVFEVGTGSGYQAAVCGEIAGEVYTVEIVEKLADSAKDRLENLGYRNVRVRHADGYFGWEQKAPFDAIIITAATGFVPPPLIEQLEPGGRMILPLGSPYGSQWLVLITKDDKGEVRSRSLIPVRFVPMTGRAMEAERPSGK
jgi:protein-L-isoaspartate(D-aspartate) O-methyltransferase